MIHSVEGQINLFDIIAEQETVPLIPLNTPIFIVEFDVVLRATATRYWLCTHNPKSYYGYNINFENGGCNTIWDYSIGDMVFFSQEEAEKAASECQHDKIDPGRITLDECQSWEYFRELDNHRLTATIAKIGDTRLYDHDFMCYHFIREFSTKATRDKEYKKLKLKIIEEASARNATELETPVFETVYRADVYNNIIYSSRAHALHHMKYFES